MPKFTIEDYDKMMEDVRQRHRIPLARSPIQRLREVARRRKLPRLPRT